MKAIRVKEEWQKALVYYIRYEFIKDEIKINPERINFFTPEWEFKSDSLNDKYILVLDDYNNPGSTIRFLIDSNNYG